MNETEKRFGACPGVVLTIGQILVVHPMKPSKKEKKSCNSVFGSAPGAPKSSAMFRLDF